MHSLELVRAAHIAGHLIKDLLGYNDWRCQICNRPLPAHSSTTQCCSTSLCPNCYKGWRIMGEDCIVCGRAKTIYAEIVS